MPAQSAQAFSRSGVSRSFGSFLPGAPGQAKLVPMTPPTPMVEAKSSPPSLISTWSPKYATRSPSRAFRVLPLRRTCHELVGSAATAMLRYGRVKKE